MSIPEPIPKPPADGFALFVRAVEGHIVRRFGSSHSIGYTFVPPTPEQPAGAHRWDTETIHALTDREVLAFHGEYEHEIRGGGLIEATREAWEKQTAERREKHDAAKAKRKAAENKTPATPEKAGEP